MSKAQKLPRGIVSYRGKYRARIGYKGQEVALGVFPTLTLAKEALNVARGDIARGVFETPQERKARALAEAEAAEREAARNAYTVNDLSLIHI